MHYNLEISGVNARDESEAAEVANALQTIYNTLGNADTITLAQLLKEKPALVEKAKAYKHLL
jgi:hypothetical protein